jgi:hypothetical protein
MKLLFAAILCLPIFAQTTEPLTNQSVVQLIQSGVRSDEVLRVIGAAPAVSFNLTPADTDKLALAGVSEDTIKMMAAREIYGQIPSPGLIRSGPPAAVVTSVNNPVSQQLAARADRKSRVFVGETDVFYASSFGASGFSGSANRNAAHASGYGFSGSSSGVLRFAINVMKSISEICPEKAVVVNNPDLADFFLRLDRDGRLVLSAKMVAFSRAGEMTFVGETHSISKDVRRFCVSLP